jgi:SulP family sulfate permease
MAGLAFGLRQKLQEGYSAADLRADVLAGLVVGVVALPLSMALAIASGVAPQHGLYTAIVAGVVSALLGGTRAQVTGPTAAFVVILVPIVTRFGLGGLLVAGLMAGVMILAMGLGGLGRLIQYIPHPVTTGFTAGIATVIGVIQLKDFFGLHYAGSPDSFIERLHLMWNARGTASGWELLIGAFTLALLVLLPRVLKRFPAPLVALVGAAVLALVLGRLVPGFHVATIGTRFSTLIHGHTVTGIPPLPPLPVLPWNLPGPGGAPLVISWELIRQLLPSAFAIAMLGAIESLLSAVVSDGMTQTRHDPNAELVALGVANMLCPMFGGIAATGALARTATNIRAGARSPLASVVHALFVLACTVALAPLVSYLPMAAMAALLLLVARNMSEARHFIHVVRVAPRSDVLVLVACFALTVIFDMVVSVGAGVVLAALLFMRRMAEIADVKLIDPEASVQVQLPPDVRMYEIAGPLFFGAAQKAMSAFETIKDRRAATVLVLSKVPAIDASGLVALETMLERLHERENLVVLVGLQPQPAAALARAGVVAKPGRLAIVPDLDLALDLAILHTARPPAEPAPGQILRAAS